MSLFIFKLRNTISGEIILGQDPEGWDKTSLRLRRSAKYHGIFHEFSFSLDFTKQSGKAYIDNIYETQGIKASVEIDVLYDCNQTGNFRMLFPGKLNLSKIKRTRDTLSVNIESRDLSQMIMNREDVPVDLKKLVGLDGGVLNAYTYANYDLNLHSREIFFESIAANTALPATYDNNFTAAGLGQLVVGATYNMYFQSPMSISKDELRSISDISQYVRHAAPLLIVDSGISAFHNATESLIDFPEDYVIRWNITGDWIDNNLGNNNDRTVNANLNIYYGASLEEAIAESKILTIAVVSYNEPDTQDIYTEAFSAVGFDTISMNEEDKIWLVWSTLYTVNTGGGGGFTEVRISQQYDDLDISIEANTTTPATTTKAFAIYEAWARLLESVTGVNGVLGSIYFGRKNSQPNSFPANGCGSFTAISDAMDVRGFTDKAAAVTINNMFESCNSIFNIGLGVSIREGMDIIKVEDKAFFYDSSKVMIQFDYVDDLEMSLDLSKFYNLVEIGYRKWEPEKVNGLNEHCSKHSYTNEISSNKSTLSLLSPFVASGMAMETTRRKRAQDTEDTRYDNETFIFALNRSVDGSDVPTDLDVCEKDENFTTITNVLNEGSVYNLRFSPKRNMLRHLNVLGGAIEKTAGDTYNFQKGEGNFILETDMAADGCDDDYSSVLLDEDIDLAWDDTNAELNRPLWIPEIYTFNYKLGASEYTDIRDFEGGPTGVIKFSEDGQSYKYGYLLDLDFDLINGMAKFTLLRAY